MREPPSGSGSRGHRRPSGRPGRRAASRARSCGGIASGLFAALSATTAARAAESPEKTPDAWSRIGSATWSFASDTASDLGGFVTAPLRFDASDWAVFGTVVGGIAVTGVVADRSAWANVQEDRSTGSNAVARIANQGGTAYSFAVLGGFGAYALFDRDRSSRAGRVVRDGLEATIIASGIITPTLKWVCGRERPNSAGSDTDAWQAFGGGESFPSGHTTQAFAIASVVSANYRQDWWVSAIAYPLAASVGWARMNDDKHYLSDVLAGAAIGSAVGWYVVVRHDERTAVDVAVTPWVEQGAFGVTTRMRF